MPGSENCGFLLPEHECHHEKLAQLPQELHELLSGRTTYAASGFIQNAALSQGNATSKDKPTDPCLVLQNHTQVGDVLVRPL